MKKMKLKRLRNVHINKKLVKIIIIIISTPIIVLFSYFYVTGSLMQAIFLTIMEFGLIIFIIYYDKLIIYYNKLKSKSQENSTGKLATILKGLEVIIHQNYPFKETNLRYMKPSFYEYMDSGKYQKARDQILRKFNLEEKSIKDTKVRLYMIGVFLSRKGNFLPPPENKYRKIDTYNIPMDVLIEGMRRESPKYLRSLKYELKKLIQDLDFIAQNVINLLSQSGMTIFLTEKQSLRGKSLNRHFHRYRKYKIEESLNLKSRDIDTLDLDSTQLTFENLINLIDLDKLKEINEFLGEIQEYIEFMSNNLKASN